MAPWLRILNGDTVAAAVLQCEMQKFVDSHSVVVTRKGKNVTLLVLCLATLIWVEPLTLQCRCVTMEWSGGDHSCREMHPLRSHIFPERVTQHVQQIRDWMQSEIGRLIAAIDLCSDGGVCHRTRKVTGGFAILCTDSRGSHIRCATHP